MTLSKEMQAALDNPAVHGYTKMIIEEAQGKDICDTLHSLEFTTYLFKKHMEDTLKGLETILDGRAHQPDHCDCCQEVKLLQYCPKNDVYHCEACQDEHEEYKNY